MIVPAGAGVLAQTPEVRLTVDAPPVTRGETSIVHLDVAIPPGYYIPAETVDSLQGAWVRVVDPYFMSRQGPTYPIPDRALLPGGTNAVSVRAYRNTLSVRVPVEIPPGITGKRAILIEFGFQLCNVQVCRSFDTAQVETKVTIREPGVPKEYLTYTMDSTHVAILTDHEVAQPEDAKSLGRPLAKFGAELAGLPDDLTDVSPTQAKGSAWIVRSDGRRFEAVVERFGAAAGFDAQHGQLALVARIVTPTFQNERAKYFLASPRVTAQPPGDSPSIARQSDLTNTQRQALEALIDAQMRITLPSVFAPGYMQIKPSAYDQRVLAGKARLVYHLEAFKLASDADTRLFVRAYWVDGRRAQTGLTLWIRARGDDFVVERTDAGVTRFARIDLIEREGLLNAAADGGFAGILLNVVQAPDGFAYVIMQHSGYESFGISVFRYSSDGPVDTGIGYGEGA
jgi:hypothetical protein